MKFVFVDLETTGLNIPQKEPKGPSDEIVQIAAIATGPAPEFREIERLDLKVWPTAYGIDQIRLGVAQGFPMVYDEKVWTAEGASRRTSFERFQKFLKRYATVQKVSKTKGVLYRVAQLVGYNVKFDRDFLFGEYGKEGIFLPASGISLDVMSFISWLEALDGSQPLASMKLADVCATCGVELNNAHNAMADIEATLELARIMVEPFFRK